MNAIYAFSILDGIRAGFGRSLWLSRSLSNGTVCLREQASGSIVRFDSPFVRNVPFYFSEQGC